MVNGDLIALIVIILLVIALLVWLTIITVRNIRTQNAKPPTTIVVNTGKCIRSISSLIDISKLNCCCQSGFSTDRRYVIDIDAVVGPTPVDYLDACSGFCEDGKFDPITEGCITGSSSDFNACVNITKPINCKGPAMPVAAIGSQVYYVQSATNSSCKTSGACSPGTNTCPLIADSVDTQSLFRAEAIQSGSNEIL
jgi:hypothetical protein